MVQMTAGSGMKNIQDLIPIVGSGEGHLCGRDHKQSVLWKNLRMGDVKERNTHREREREAERGISLLSRMQQLQMTTNLY